MTPVFLSGPLADDRVLGIVLGLDPIPPASDATYSDHQLQIPESGYWPVLVRQIGAVTNGVLIPGLAADARKRLDYYLQVFGQEPSKGTVTTKAGLQDCILYRPKVADTGSHSQWSDQNDRVMEIAAAEIIASYGRFPADIVAQRLPQILQRASSFVRAGAHRYPGGVRQGFGREDVEVRESRQPYVNYFAVREDDIRYRRFDGSQSELITRAAFVGGDAAVVLPYDPKRDRVMVIEQFRFGLFVRGDPTPWAMEPIAGRIDVGETPEDTARREAQEEAGLELSRLLPVAQFYPSSGAYSEYLYVYIGLADLPDGINGVSGLDDEAEDIRSHVLGFETVQEMIANGEIHDGQLMMAMLWLDRQRETIRADT